MKIREFLEIDLDWTVGTHKSILDFEGLRIDRRTYGDTAGLAAAAGSLSRVPGNLSSAVEHSVGLLTERTARPSVTSEYLLCITDLTSQECTSSEYLYCQRPVWLAASYETDLLFIMLKFNL